MFLALVSVMVALYGTARTIAVQAVMSMICCLLLGRLAG